MVEFLVVGRMVQNAVFSRPDRRGTASVQIYGIVHTGPERNQSAFGQCSSVSVILRASVDGDEIIVAAAVLSYQCPRMTCVAELPVSGESRYLAVLNKQRS